MIRFCHKFLASLITDGRACSSEDLKPFYLRSTELTSEDHVLLWGLRVVLPTKIRSFILNLLHDTHIVVVRMKGLARS